MWRGVLIIGSAIAIIAAAVFIFFLGSNEPLPEREAINLNDPNVVAIAQGTEGDIHSLEIGVGFVGTDGSASISIYDAGQPENGNVEESITVGSSIPLEGYFILVLDVDGPSETVTLEVLPLE